MPAVPAVPTVAAPELAVPRYEDEPAFSRPPGLVKLAKATRPTTSESPLLKEPISVPSGDIVKDSRGPAARPSWLATGPVLMPAKPVRAETSTATPPTVSDVPDVSWPCPLKAADPTTVPAAFL